MPPPPLSGIYGHLKRSPKDEDMVPSKGPPTMVEARFMAEPTETPTLLLGNKINRDSTITERTDQNINILKFRILKFKINSQISLRLIKKSIPIYIKVFFIWFHLFASYI